MNSEKDIERLVRQIDDESDTLRELESVRIVGEARKSASSHSTKIKPKLTNEEKILLGAYNIDISSLHCCLKYRLGLGLHCC